MPRAIHELEQRAKAHGYVLESTAASLKTQLSRWENDHVPLSDPTYLRLFGEMYGLSVSELRSSPMPALTGLNLDAEIPPALLLQSDKANVDAFHRETERLRTLDRRVGASKLQEEMVAHVREVDASLRGTASITQRRKLAQVLADAASLTGWQALDAGAITWAWNLHDLAKRAAIEGNDDQALAHAAGQQAYVLLEANRPRDAIALISEARKSEQTLPYLLRAWLAAVHAEVLAVVGAAAPARRAMHLADRLLPDQADANLPYLALDASHLTRWRGSVLSRLGDSHGITASLDALDGLDKSFVRARAGLLADLGEALLHRSEHVDSKPYVQEAHALAEQIGSQRLSRRLERVRVRLDSSKNS